jgi:hypothetical protein
MTRIDIIIVGFALGFTLIVMTVAVYGPLF